MAWGAGQCGNRPNNQGGGWGSSTPPPPGLPVLPCRGLSDPQEAGTLNEVFVRTPNFTSQRWTPPGVSQEDPTWGGRGPTSLLLFPASQQLPATLLCWSAEIPRGASGGWVLECQSPPGALKRDHCWPPRPLRGIGPGAGEAAQPLGPDVAVVAGHHGDDAARAGPLRPRRTRRRPGWAGPARPACGSQVNVKATQGGRVQQHTSTG